ncbi:hypothetical protein DelCs14_4114 [Delftia sp. Cs1-4]|uniref:AAA family ATPase n=1 Tax=Delftia sp. (strain Cs1-4) TaxID=742013 RepID=UPI00020E86EC|nr:AAA family ATPase [Delftia sp. Cs1-4]AEF91097.1 hypothetical protein DelCs14_4114 [Delftia sp. Cs1-4]
MSSALTFNTRLLLLSGAVGSGKTSVTTALLDTYRFRKVSTGRHLTGLATAQGLSPERAVLQQLGDTLDVQTDYAWPVNVAVEQMQKAAGGEALVWLLDAVRKPRQVAHFREAFAHVLHVHLTASEEVLRARYLQRQSAGDKREAAVSYEALVCHPNEVASRALGSIADVVYNSGDRSAYSIANDIVQTTQGLQHGPSGVD